MARTKIALAAMLLVGTGSAALAEDGFRPNPAKRYPAYTGGNATQSAPMRLNQDRNVSTPNGNLMMNVMDRASSPFACGG
jgi:hypothetical protein